MISYLTPESIEEAIGHASEHPDSILAGGTVWMPLISRRLSSPEVILDISQLPELRQVEKTDEAALIGAAVTLDEIERHPALAAFPMLASAAGACASPEIRRQGTIGGNIESPLVPGDLLPALVALDAQVEILGASGSRRLPVADHVTSVGTSRAPGEILIRVWLPTPPPARQAYEKVGRRRGFAPSVVTGALLTRLDLQGRIEFIRIVLGAIERPPRRLKECEVLCVGRQASPELAIELGALTIEAVGPHDEYWASAAHQAAQAGALVTRLTAHAWDLNGTPNA